MERKLAAILAADVVGYSRLMGEDEVKTLAALKAHRNELIDPEIARHNGRIVKLIGDGALVEFASVVDAVQCAVAIQQGMENRNASSLESERITFRIGINLGDVIVEGDDLYGDGVNVAARLEGLAEPGGICLSRAARDQVRDKLDVNLVDLGEVQVKNIARPVRAFSVVRDAEAVDGLRGKRFSGLPNLGSFRRHAAVLLVLVLFAIGGLAWKFWPQQVTILGDKPAIVVLPFENSSGDSAHDYFADGLTEDLITDLSKAGDLLVVPPQVVFRYKGKATTPDELRQELHVSHVLNGSVKRASERMRITVQLTDTESGFQIWAERFDRKLDNFFVVQDEIVGSIVDALKIELDPAERKLLERQSTVNVKALDAYLLGRATLRKWTPAANAEGTRLLQDAVLEDPRYTDAMVQLAWAHFQSWILDGSRRPELLQQGEVLARQAVESNPAAASAHTMPGWMYLWQKRHDEAIAAMRKALDLDPNYAMAHARLSETLMFAGEPAAAVEQIALARQRTTEDFYAYGFWAGEALFYENRLEEAARELKHSIAQNPVFFASRRFLAAVYIELGRNDEAKEQMQRALQLNPRLTESLLRRQLPFRRSEDLERQLKALGEAGLPK